MIIDKKDFDQLVEEAFLKIPAEFRDEMENVALVIESEAPDRFGGNKKTLLGLFEGIPKTSLYSPFRGVQPSKITLYEAVIQRSAENLEELEKLIQEVLMHEVAHYFGYNERQMVYMDEKLRKKLRG